MSEGAKNAAKQTPPKAEASVDGSVLGHGKDKSSPNVRPKPSPNENGGSQSHKGIPDSRRFQDARRSPLRSPGSPQQRSPKPYMGSPQRSPSAGGKTLGSSRQAWGRGGGKVGGTRSNGGSQLSSPVLDARSKSPSALAMVASGVPSSLAQTSPPTTNRSETRYERTDLLRMGLSEQTVEPQLEDHLDNLRLLDKKASDWVLRLPHGDCQGGAMEKGRRRSAPAQGLVDVTALQVLRALKEESAKDLKGNGVFSQEALAVELARAGHGVVGLGSPTLQGQARLQSQSARNSPALNSQNDPALAADFAQLRELMAAGKIKISGDDENGGPHLLAEVTRLRELLEAEKEGRRIEGQALTVSFQAFSAKLFDELRAVKKDNESLSQVTSTLGSENRTLLNRMESLSQVLGSDSHLSHSPTPDAATSKRSSESQEVGSPLRNGQSPGANYASFPSLDAANHAAPAVVRPIAAATVATSSAAPAVAATALPFRSTPVNGSPTLVNDGRSSAFARPMKSAAEAAAAATAAMAAMGAVGVGKEPPGPSTPEEWLDTDLCALSVTFYGSRLIQTRLDIDTEERTFFEHFFEQLQGHEYELMTNKFGRFAFEKLLSLCQDEERTVILRSLAPKLHKVACDAHGSFGAQVLVKALHTEEQLDLLVAAVSPHILELITHYKGHYLVVVLLTHFPYERFSFIDDAIIHNFVAVTTNNQGLQAMKAVFKSRSAEEIARILKVISDNVLSIVEHQYGNYVVQQSLSCASLPITFMPGSAEDVEQDQGAPEVLVENKRHKQALLGKLKGRIRHLSQLKFASNVVEFCLKTLQSTHWTALVISELLADPPGAVKSLINDRYGNYVLQTALLVANAQQLEMITLSIRLHLPSFRPSLRNKWTKLILAACERGGLGKTSFYEEVAAAAAAATTAPLLVPPTDARQPTNPMNASRDNTPNPYSPRKGGQQGPGGYLPDGNNRDAHQGQYAYNPAYPPLSPTYGKHGGPMHYPMEAPGMMLPQQLYQQQQQQHLQLQQQQQQQLSSMGMMPGMQGMQPGYQPVYQQQGMGMPQQYQQQYAPDPRFQQSAYAYPQQPQQGHPSPYYPQR